MEFLKRYLHANSGTMVNERFTLWSGISLLATVAGRRIYIDHGHFQILPNMYICLVGRMGLRKSVPKDFARDLLQEALPDYPLGNSTMSREFAVKYLSSDACLRSYTDEHGNLIEWHPCGFYIDELKNFMSVDIEKMVAFLTEIYNRPFFDAGTIKHGLQIIPRPCVNILACETPDWIIEKFKSNILTGGFARRMLYVYVIDPSPERIAFPEKTQSQFEAQNWCKEHLRKIQKVVGKIQWEPKAKKFFADWFRALPHQSNPILEGFYENKDIIVSKVAMALCLAYEEPNLVFTQTLIEGAIEIVEQLEDNLPKLTAAVGRNPLGVAQQRLLQLIEARNGMMLESVFHRAASAELTENEYRQVMEYFQKTDQLYVRRIVAPNGTQPSIVVTPKWLEINDKAFQKPVTELPETNKENGPTNSQTPPAGPPEPTPPPVG